MQKNTSLYYIVAVFIGQLLLVPTANSQSYTITTIAGTGTAGFSGDGGPASVADLSSPSTITIDIYGNIYIGDAANNRIRKIDKTGIITTFAGNGTAGYSADGGPATAAELNNAIGVTADHSGNIFIADEYNQRIRIVNGANTINTFAGNGKISFSGDGGPATAAQMFFPIGVAKDGSGNIYIADCWNHRIRKVNTSGIISTIAGNGKGGFSGDGGQATAAELNFPNGITVDASGNIYIADNNNNRIRKINTSGVISTIAGTGFGWYGGDGGPATSAWINNPTDIAVDASGNIYIADKNNSVIRMVNTSGTISTFAGTGLTAGYAGDGGNATAAELNHPWGIAVDASGNVYISDNNNNRIREVNTSGIINTIAGTGTAGYSGDGGAATSAQINNPFGVAIDGLGNIYFGDANNNRIRKINTGGIISTAVGTGTAGFSGDGGPATAAKINNPLGVIIDGSGNMYIADEFSQRIRMINTSGIISTVAGNGNLSYSGDGGLADSAQIFFPTYVALGAAGSYIADCFNHRIRKVSNGIITTFAGDGNWGYAGDGAQATSAELSFPTSVAADPLGNVYIADYGNARIRKVSSSGVITTFAGNGIFGYSGDGGPATAAKLNAPTGVAIDGFGNILIADKNNGVIRRVDKSGTITTVAGNGTQGFSGDGAAATAAQLNNPWGVMADFNGNIYIADYGNQRVRKLTPSCTFNDSITAHTNVTCVGGNNGSATSTPSLGTLPYTFSWAPSGGTNATASNLTAGTYTVTVTDAGGCVASATIIITQPPYTINTVGGNGLRGDMGDGGPATAARLLGPWMVAIDPSGNLYFADHSNQVIRKISIGGIITKVAGVDTTFGYSGDNGQATAAELNGPPGVALDAAGKNLYIADQNNQRIRKVDLSTGVITTFAGNGTLGYSGDTGPATAAEIDDPSDVSVDAAGNVYIADAGNLVIRKVDVSGNITTVAGNGNPGYTGDGGLATAAEFSYPSSVTSDGTGNLFVGDWNNHVIRKIDASTGIITTIAGNGTSGFSGDGGPAIAAEFGTLLKAIPDSKGNVLVTDGSNQRIRIIGSSGIINTIAGNGAATFGGDGGLAIKASLQGPIGIAEDGSGNIYFADSFNNRIRKLYGCPPYCSLKANASVVSNASCYGINDGVIQASTTTTGINPFMYSWSPSGGTNATASGMGVGTYTVTIMDSIGCSSTASVAISATPIGALISGPDSICLGDVITLTATGGSSYVWNNGSTGSSITVSPKNDTLYSVTVTNGPCTDTTSHPLVVGTGESLCALHFYNGLTPNSDGHNDYWIIDNIELSPDNTVEIYNRWGTKMWSANGYDNNKVVWKGQNSSGHMLPDGTYYYIVKVNSRTYKGWVELTH